MSTTSNSSVAGFDDFTAVSPFERLCLLLERCLHDNKLVGVRGDSDGGGGGGGVYASCVSTIQLHGVLPRAYDLAVFPPRTTHDSGAVPPAPAPLPATAVPPDLETRATLEALFGVPRSSYAVVVTASTRQGTLPRAEVAMLSSVLVSACSAAGVTWPCFVDVGNGGFVGAMAPNGVSNRSWRFEAVVGAASKPPVHTYTLSHLADVLSSRIKANGEFDFSGWTRRRHRWQAPVGMRACRQVHVSVDLIVAFDNIDVRADVPLSRDANRAALTAAVSTRPAPARRRAEVSADRTVQIDALAAVVAEASTAMRGAVSDVWPVSMYDSADARMASESAMEETFAPRSDAEAAAFSAARSACQALGHRHVAPIGSLLDRAARAAAVAALGPAGSAGVAAFWRSFCHALRFEHWEKRVPMPRMEVDDEVAAEGGVDLRCCLLAQKLQMLQRCIEECGRAKAAAESHQLSSPNRASSSVKASAARGVKHALPLRALHPPHAKLNAPETLPAPPVSEDMLTGVTSSGVDDDDDGLSSMRAAAASAAASKMHRVALQSDMSAFKAANPGCCLEDFIRFHSPRDWIVDENDEEKDDEDSTPRGHLSQRMASPGSEWRRLWQDAPCTPAEEQAPLFLPVTQAEKALHYLETADADELLAQLLACAVNANLSGIVVASAAERQQRGVSASVQALAEGASVFLRRGVEVCASERGLAAAGISAELWLPSFGEESSDDDSELRASFRRCEEAAGLSSTLLALLPVSSDVVKLADAMCDELVVRLDEARRLGEALHTDSAEGSECFLEPSALASLPGEAVEQEHVVAVVSGGGSEFWDASSQWDEGVELAAPCNGATRARAYVKMCAGRQILAFCDS